MKPATMILAAVALSLAAIGPSAIRAAEKPLNPKAIAIKLPEQIPWVRNAAETAILYGDPKLTGLYVVMNKWLPGNMSRQHWHPNDRAITVLKGTWWVGTGDKFDPANLTVPMQPGTPSSPTSPRACIGTAPRTRTRRCSSSAKGRPPAPSRKQPSNRAWFPVSKRHRCHRAA